MSSRSAGGRFCWYSRVAKGFAALFFRASRRCHVSRHRVLSAIDEAKVRSSPVFSPLFGTARKTMVTGDIWDQVLSRIENKVNRHSFYTWFKPTTFVARPGRRAAGARAERRVPRLAGEALRGHHRGSADRARRRARVVQFVTEVAASRRYSDCYSRRELEQARRLRCPRRSPAVPA